MRAGLRVKVGEDRQHGEQETYNVAAAVVEKHAATREVERQETNQRTGEQECQRRNEILPLLSSVPSEKPAADSPQSSA